MGLHNPPVEALVALPPIFYASLGIAAPRSTVELLIESMIAALDVADGEADREDATDLEDDFALTWLARGSGAGPGCKISDSGGDFANEDDPSGYRQSQPYGPGCPISDPGGAATVGQLNASDTSFRRRA